MIFHAIDSYFMTAFKKNTAGIRNLAFIYSDIDSSINFISYINK